MAGLNLLAAIVICWNTAHLGETVRQRKHAGLTVEPEFLAHISPLGWAHTCSPVNTGGQSADSGLSVRFCPLPESTRWCEPRWTAWRYPDRRPAQSIPRACAWTRATTSPRARTDWRATTRGTPTAYQGRVPNCSGGCSRAINQQSGLAAPGHTEQLSFVRSKHIAGGILKNSSIGNVHFAVPIFY